MGSATETNAAVARPRRVCVEVHDVLLDLVIVDLAEQMRQKAKEALRKPFEAVKKILEKYPDGLSGNELFEKTGGNRTTQLALFRNLEKHGFLTFFEKKYVLPVFSKKSGSQKLTLLKSPGTS